jgi:hypothetical protein
MVDPISLAAVFNGAVMVTRLAAWTGLMDKVGPRVDQLLQADLSAGFRSLDQALHATGEQVHLLREARVSFNKAVTLEAGLRKSAALMGLAACHNELGEQQLHLAALEEILAIEPVGGADLLRAIGKDVVDRPLQAGKAALNGPVAAAMNLVEGPRRLVAAVAANPLHAAQGVAHAAHDMVKRLGDLRHADARRVLLRNITLDAVRASEDTKRLIRLQDAVSIHIGKPIPWIERLASQ